MSTIACVDYRRTDLRTNVLESPFWITSGLASAVTCDDKVALLFSFPKVKQLILIHEVAVQVVEALTASTTIDIGTGTIATDAAVTGDNVTYSALDGFITNADIAVTANTINGALVGTGSTWLTLKASRAYTTPRFLVGVATAVPCVFAAVARTGVIAAGTFKVHMLITIVPGT